MVELAAGEAPHFLVVTYPAQGHINPARHLALRLLRATPGARVTVSTAVSACRKMFPDAGEAEEHVDGAGVRYAPFSDGFDGGFKGAAHDHTDYMSQLKVVGPRTLHGVLARLRDAGRPVTQVVYTVLLSWVAGVARAHGVPSALYWIQPATVLATYFHFFRRTDGFDKAVAAAAADPWAEVRLPGFPAPLCLRDLPSFLTITSDEHPYAFVLHAFRDLLDELDDDRQEDRRGATMLANTFEAMEPDAMATLRQHGLDVVPVGPVLSFLDAAPASTNGNDMFKQDGKGYLEWLDAQAEASVVYISFGSLSSMSKRQIEEVARGMTESGSPFLWVLRKDNRGEVDGDDLCDCAGERAWWWSGATRGSVACGVPVVGVPQWTDQGTNAWLVERQLGTGVRAAVSDKDGVLEADELRRCIGFATSEMVRAKATLWREKARAAAAVGGSSERNLRAFVAGN
ncbi:unnamed protein product [Alopecurus aequalis]